MKMRLFPPGTHPHLTYQCAANLEFSVFSCPQCDSQLLSAHPINTDDTPFLFCPDCLRTSLADPPPLAYRYPGSCGCATPYCALTSRPTSQVLIIVCPTCHLLIARNACFIPKTTREEVPCQIP